MRKFLLNWLPGYLMSIIMSVSTIPAFFFSFFVGVGVEASGEGAVESRFTSYKCLVVRFHLPVALSASRNSG
eukprot:gene7213-5070_t